MATLKTVYRSDVENTLSALSSRMIKSLFVVTIFLSSSLLGCLGESGNDIEDFIDADNDGIADYSDSCPGFNDFVDLDGDDVYDLLIVDPTLCADYFDSDGDNIVDSQDQCMGSDDNLDMDGDDVPDGCDELIDTDGDGVGDEIDICPEGNDTIDIEGDGNADLLIIDDNYCGFVFDSDFDGVPDNEDKCEGYDDNTDVDLDGIPDRCDEEVIIPKLLVMTVDVEAKFDSDGAVDIAVFGIDGEKRAGIIEMMDVADEFDIKISFFVDVIEIYLHGEKWGDMMRLIFQRGHDVQLHFHPRLLSESDWNRIENSSEWIASGAKRGVDANCWNQDTADYFWNDAMRIFDELEITRPIAFRGGGYRFCDTSIVAMKKTNMTQSYNYNQFSTAQSFAPERGYMDHFTWENGVMEFPISYVRWEDGEEIHPSRRIDESLIFNANESYWGQNYTLERYFNHTSPDPEIYRTQVMTFIWHSFSFLSHREVNGTREYFVEDYSKIESFRFFLENLPDGYRFVSSTQLQEYIDAGAIAPNVEIPLDLIGEECDGQSPDHNH